MASRRQFLKVTSGAFIVAASASHASAQSAKFTAKIGHLESPTQPRHRGLEKVAALVKERTKGEVDVLQRYPMPYQRDIVGAARAEGLEPAFVFGLIRQETRFMAQMRSYVGASGLMQLMPSTAKWAARKVVVSVEILREDDRPRFRLFIDDDGPGLPEAARAEVLKRGRRLDETKPGSGLGLSIVSDLAALYRGSLRLDASPMGGLRAILELPGDRSVP